MERKNVLTRLACIGAVVIGPLVLGGCGRANSASSAESVVPASTSVEGKTESSSVLYIRRSLNYSVANFLITRKSSDSFIISDVTKKDSYLDNSINPVTLPAAINYMRENGCVCGDTISFTNGVNYQITVTNPEDCLSQLK